MILWFLGHPSDVNQMSTRDLGEGVTFLPCSGSWLCNFGAMEYYPEQS